VLVLGTPPAGRQRCVASSAVLLYRKTGIWPTFYCNQVSASRPASPEGCWMPLVAATSTNDDGAHLRVILRQITHWRLLRNADCVRFSQQHISVDCMGFHCN
jgi:hypothetical protein